MNDQLLLADNRYRDRLLVVTTREQLDKWFAVTAHCFFGNSCHNCCAFLNFMCARQPGCPFCTAFTCAECGCNCTIGAFGWLQELLDKAEAEGVWR